MHIVPSRVMGSLSLGSGERGTVKRGYDWLSAMTTGNYLLTMIGNEWLAMSFWQWSAIDLWLWLAMSFWQWSGLWLVGYDWLFVLRMIIKLWIIIYNASWLFLPSIRGRNLSSVYVSNGSFFFFSWVWLLIWLNGRVWLNGDISSLLLWWGLGMVRGRS